MRRALLHAAPLLLVLARLGIAADLRVPSEHATLPDALEASESGDRILLEPGTYVIGNRLLIGNRAIEIACEAPDQRALLLDAWIRALDEDSASQASLSLTRIDFSGSPGAGRIPFLIEASGMRAITLRDCTVRDFASRGTRGPIELQDVRTTTISGCEFLRVSADESVIDWSLSADSPEGTLSISDSNFENCPIGDAGLIRAQGAGTFTLIECAFLGSARGTNGSACLRLGADVVARVERSHFLRNGGAALLCHAASSVQLDQTTIVGETFAWQTDRGLPHTPVDASRSILWSPPPTAWLPVPPIRLRNCCYSGFPVEEAVDCLIAEPRFCAWGRDRIVLDASSTLAGDGTPARPYRDLPEAMSAWSHALSPDSPCRTAGPEGGPIGAPADACPTAPPTGPVSVELRSGEYSAPSGSIFANEIRILGSGPEETVLMGALGPIDGDAEVSGLTVRLEPGAAGQNLAGVHFRGARAAMTECRIEGRFSESVRSEAETTELRDTVISGGQSVGVATTARGRLHMTGVDVIGSAEVAVSSNVEVLAVRDCLIFGSRSERLAPFPARRGRGILLSGGVRSALVEGTRFLWNGAREAGGALALTLVADGNLRVEGCEFIHNRTETGGAALRVFDAGAALGSMHIIDSTFIDNRSSSRGSAIRARVQDGSMVHCTLWSNPSGDGATVLIDSEESFRIESSILWDESPSASWSQSSDTLEVHASCVSGELRPPGSRNVAQHPSWCRASTTDIVYVDAAAPPGGDGSRERPFSNLTEAGSGTSTLSADSPCVGTALDDGNMGAEAQVALTPCAQRVRIGLAPGTYRAEDLIETRPWSLHGNSPGDTTVFGSLRTNDGDSRIESLRLVAAESYPALTILAGHSAALVDAEFVTGAGDGVRVGERASCVAEACRFDHLSGAGLVLDRLAEARLERCELFNSQERALVGGAAWTTAAESSLRLTRCIVRNGFPPTPSESEPAVQRGNLFLESCFLGEGRVNDSPVDSGSRLVLEGGLLHVESSTCVLVEMSSEPFLELRADATAMFRNSILWSAEQTAFFDSQTLDDANLRFERTAFDPERREEPIDGTIGGYPSFVQFPQLGRGLDVERFRLRWDSRLLDLASRRDAPTTDLAGTVRDCHGGPDIGCFEYCGARRPPRPFLRGDVDESGNVTLTDAVQVLDRLFAGRSRLTCLVAADVDDNERVDVSDAIRLLDWLFLQGRAPAGAFPECERTGAALVAGCRSPVACE